jgi:hypothetical protein
MADLSEKETISGEPVHSPIECLKGLLGGFTKDIRK